MLAAVVIVAAAMLIIVLSSDKLHGSVTVEAGSALEVSQFIKKENYQGTFITDLSALDLNSPGVHTIEIQIGEKIYASKLRVVDTVPPSAEAVNREIWIDEAIDAEQFVTNVVDVTDVSIAFREQPDFSKAGVQEIAVILKDTSGNTLEVSAFLTIYVDSEPPVIEGAVDQTVFIGTRVAYRKGVSVTDNRDEKVELQVDSSNVNLNKPGAYEVIYKAIDSSGNVASVTAIFTVKEKPQEYMTEEEVYAQADKVLAKILKKGMTEPEKAWAIYRWVKKHMSYTGTSEKSNWIQGAATGFKRGTGDCFIYYSLSRALLTRAGFENLCVERIESATPPRHYWNLVKVNGSWYHFDTNPYRVGYPYVPFLRTDDEVEEYSKRCKNFFAFDRSKYPPTPTEPLKFNRNW